MALKLTHKLSTTTTVKRAADNVRTFCASSATPDRDNDVITQSGWETGNFAANPVILWAHDYQSMPVGVGSNWRTVGDKSYIDIRFADTEEGQACLEMVDAGCLNAVSVGFRPLESSYDSARDGVNFLRQELLEVSIVPVPANPEALVVRAKALGLSASVIRKMFGAGDDDRDIVLRLADEPGADDIVLTLADPIPDPRARTHDGHRGEPPTIDHGMFRQVLSDSLPGLIAESLRQIPALVTSELSRQRGRVD